MNHKLIRCLLFQLGGVVSLVSWAAAVACAGDSTISFNRDIRPILSNNCFQCHGPDEKQRKADLRLDTEDGVFASLGDHAAVVRGKPQESALIERIGSKETGKLMPPKKTGKKLSVQEVELITRWVKEGAPYLKHWSYIKPRRAALPQVSDKSWPRNSIDHFILARLDREKLKPSPEADRYVLIRRVSLDLTGLPPSWKEVEEFVKDKDPNAYEKLVDRLLKQTSYGEHWGYMWLDLARYADSAGYADDPLRTIWLFRDYVITSLNANKPFNQFTIEQIAGDLLPNPTQDQIIATAFHRNTLTNSEGGTVDEEFRNVAVVDRVNTTMAVWMGTTMNCAQCHSHKYDPITQEEYFRFFAFFNQSEDADRSDETPLLPIYSEKQKQQRQQLQDQIAKLETTLRTITPEIKAGQAKWEERFRTPAPWQNLKPSAVTTKSGVKVDIQAKPAEAVVAVPTTAKQDTYTVEIPIAGSAFQSLRLEALPDDKLPGKGPGHGGGNFVITRLKAVLSSPMPQGKVQTAEIKFSKAVADFAQAGFEPGNVILDPNPMKKGWAVAGQTGKPHTLTLTSASPVQIPAGAKLTVTIEQNSPYENHTLGRFRLSATADAEAAEITPAIQAVLQIPAAKRSPQQQTSLDEHYRTLAPELKPARQKLAELTKQLADVKPATVPIMKDLPAAQRRVTKIQHRGNYLDLGKEVAEGTPAAFHELPKGAQRNRLTLAKWLVDENNPLTARVIANRYWEQIFGIGIVSTSEEFGAQGEQPFHPELLDWLATELHRLNWDMKAFVKMLVTSAAYRQSSRVTAEMYQRDPENRLLASGPRFRLSAEMVRDQALLIGGLLSPKMLGPSVQPPQPSVGLTAAFGSSTDWTTSAGEDRYRRALYTMWRRSNPYPSMAAFDAPNREVCTVRRVRTNTPLQALVTLNDPVYIEAAQALARKTVTEGGVKPADRARFAFSRCLSRPPQESELTRLVALYELTLKRLQPQPEQARKLAADPLGPVPPNQNVTELAAWTVVGNVLLNLDEMLMKR